jgi:hypothetical protein
MRNQLNRWDTESKALLQSANERHEMIHKV